MRYIACEIEIGIGYGIQYTVAVKRNVEEIGGGDERLTYSSLLVDTHIIKLS